MKIFIEQGGQEMVKNIFDKETKSLLRTVPFHISYPYPYGHIVNTLSEDGDELDCYIITEQKFAAGAIVEAESIGMLECFDSNEADHKVLMVLAGEKAVITNEVKDRLKYFGDHFYDNRPAEATIDGEYLGIDEAEALIRKCQI